MVTELMHEFQINATQIGILSAVFYFIYTPMQIVVGLLTDLYGPRKTLTLAVISCTIGSYIFGIAPSLPVAIAGRLLIGFGSAFAFVTVLKLAATWLPHRFFAFFVGLTNTLGMIGGMASSIILIPLVHNIGWKHTISVGTFFGIILIPLVWLIVRDKPQTKSKNETKTKPRYQETFIGLLKILKKPQMWLNGLIACSMYVSLSVFGELWGNQFLANVYHLSTSSVGTANSMVFLGWLIGAPLIGYISDVTYSRKIPILIGCLLSTFFISMIIYIPQMNIGLLYLLLFLSGLSASCEVLCFAVSKENSPNLLIATASAFTNFLTMIGGIVFQPLVGKILDLFWLGQTMNGDRVYSAVSYQYALTILPLAFLLGFILTFWLRETHERKVSSLDKRH
jgi:MFS family permease